jgi:hypothetical protein
MAAALASELEAMQEEIPGESSTSLVWVSSELTLTGGGESLVSITTSFKNMSEAAAPAAAGGWGGDVTIGVDAFVGESGARYAAAGPLTTVDVSAAALDGEEAEAALAPAPAPAPAAVAAAAALREVK